MPTIYKLYLVVILVNLISNPIAAAEAGVVTGDECSSTCAMLARAASLNCEAVAALNAALARKPGVKAQASFAQAQIKLAAAASLSSSALDRIHLMPPMVDSGNSLSYFSSMASDWAMQSALTYLESDEIKRAHLYARNRRRFAAAERQAEEDFAACWRTSIAVKTPDSRSAIEADKILDEHIDHVYTEYRDTALAMRNYLQHPVSEPIATHEELSAAGANLAAAITTATVLKASDKTLRELQLNPDHSGPWRLAAVKSLKEASRLRASAAAPVQ